MKNPPKINVPGSLGRFSVEPVNVRTFPVDYQREWLRARKNCRKNAPLIANGDENQHEEFVMCR